MRMTTFLALVALNLILAACSKMSGADKRSPSSELSGGEETNFYSIPEEEEFAFVIKEEEKSTEVRVTKSGYEYRSEGLPGTGRYFNPRCKNFIKDNGSLGSWGKKLIESMKRVEKTYEKSCFFGNSSQVIKFGKRCRGTEYFKSLTSSQQENIWVWLWASIAQAESSCIVTASGQGIWNRKFQRFNKADGLFQLEHYTETRNANARDKNFCPDKTDTKALNFQFDCAASIMAKAQCGEFLKNKSSYWEKMIKNKGKVWRLLNKHPLCRG